MIKVLMMFGCFITATIEYFLKDAYMMGYSFGMLLISIIHDIMCVLVHFANAYIEANRDKLN